MLNPTAFGLAMGAVYAFLMAAIALGARTVRALEGATSIYARVFPGYEATPRGILVGTLYGLAVGFGFGWTVALLYNAFRRAEPAAMETAERAAGAARR